MKIYIVTIFPGLTDQVGKYGIVRRAIEAGCLNLESVDLRKYAADAHRSVDDAPFGGGPGMVFLAEPIFSAVEEAGAASGVKPFVVYLSPQGERICQELVEELAKKECLVLIAGRYEGVDQRVLDKLVDKEVSFGDFVLSGGELPAMALVDAIARKIPGALGNQGSHDSESFADGLLDFPNYTRPESFRGIVVPEILLTGNRQSVERWRRWQSLRATRVKRPDLWEKYCRRFLRPDVN